MRLIERSGPFLSMPVLLETFPQGLSADDRDRRVLLRDAYDSWQSDRHEIAVHRAWVKYVLTQALELPEAHIVDSGHIPQNLSVRVDVHHETLTPDMAVIEPTDGDQPGTPRMVVMVVPPDQALDKKLPGKNWAASPQTRMSDLVRGCNDAGITFGLLTNGEQWMLVYSKQGETASFTTWYASIWFDEKVTLRAFRDLLSAQRFYGDPDRTLDKLYEQSADDQHEVTDQLGLQVRDAIETLVSAIDEINRDRNNKLLKGFSEEQLYEACVTVMMRLVFLFFAEERRLLPVQESFYEENYSLHSLFDRLQTQKNMGEEGLEWAYSGWCRLLALFRAIHGGVQHDDMQLHAYGSSLFDPDRFPFLEGRPQGTAWRELEAQPLPINDRTLLHVLEALKLLEVRGIGGGQRITRAMSFRELDVEDIGHIYESLLDHTAKRAKGHVLGLVGSKGKEPELSLDELEKHSENGLEALVEYLKDETGKTAKAIEKLLDAEIALDESRLLAACGNDQAFLARVKPLANLIRENRSGDPIIIPDGSVYVTEGTDRRSSGTHYTPKSLTEPIVEHTLEPLVYEGPAKGKPQDEWKLKTPAEILELKVCDMACGSGAFLVQACRYMAERLVEAWEYIEQTSAVPTDDLTTDTGNIVVETAEDVELIVEKNGQHSTKTAVRRLRITPLGELSKNDPSEELIPLDPAERTVYAQRIVADRCLYGVDKNSLAVEMAKLSLWLLTLAKDKPFNFIDHAIRQGDSLLGIGQIDHLIRFSLFDDVKVRPLMLQQREQIERRLSAVMLLRKQIEGRPTNTSQDGELKSQLMRNIENQNSRLRYAADLLLAASFPTQTKSEIESATNSMLTQAVYNFRDRPTEELCLEAQEELKKAGVTERFHWAIEFPEVYEHGGFDAFIGNPPFMGGTVASTNLGVDYMSFQKSIHDPWHGKADLVGLFYRRAEELLAPKAFFGFLATASLCRGETADHSLCVLGNNGWMIYRAKSPFPWPGSANVTAVCTWLTREDWLSAKYIDDERVEQIGIDLEEDETEGLTPYAIEKSLPGCLGVKLSPANKPLPDELSSALPASQQSYLLPAIGGDEISDLPDPISAFRSFEVERMTDKLIHQCNSILDLSHTRKSLTHSAPARRLREEMARFPLLLACNETTHRHLAFTVFQTTEILLKHKAIGIPAPTWGWFAIVQSSFHEAWAWKYGVRRKEDLGYSPKRCCGTFPMPDGDCSSEIDNLAHEYFDNRTRYQLDHRLGLTAFYNRFHDPVVTSSEINSLRAARVELDRVVAQHYNSSELDLRRDFHPSKQGVRYTISDASRRLILTTLLKRNHFLYERQSGENTNSTKKKSTLEEESITVAGYLPFSDVDEG